MAESNNDFSSLGKDAFKGLESNFKKFEEGYNKIRSSYERLGNDIAQNVQDAVSGVKDIVKKANDLRNNQRSFSKEQLKDLNDFVSSLKSQQLKLDREVYNTVAKIASLKVQYDLERDEVNRAILRGELIELKAVEKALSQQSTLTGEIADNFDEIVKNAQVLNSSTKFFTKAQKFVESLPGGNFISAPFVKAAKAAERAAESAKGLTNTYKEGAKAFGMSILDAFSPAALLKALKVVDDEVATLGRNLNISRSSAADLRYEFSEIADSSKSIGVTTSTLVQANQDLNKQLRISTVYSADLLKNMSELSTLLGVENAARLAQIAEASGQELKTFTEQAVVAANSIQGVNISSRDVLDSISKLSSEILIDFRNQPVALGRAVAEARKLGTTITDTKNAGRQLLDFQSSIANELEAELFTGKNIRLEQARLAALRGDELTLIKELNKNIGSIADFENMSVLARQSLAKSLGMEVNQVSEILLKREAIQANEAATAELNAKQIAQARQLSRDQGISFGEALTQIGKQVSAQKQIELSMIKIQSVIADISSVFMPVLDGISGLLRAVAESPLLKGTVGLLSTLAIGAKIFTAGKNLFSRFKEGGIGGGFSGLGSSPLRPLWVKMADAGRRLGRDIRGKGALRRGGVGPRSGRFVGRELSERYASRFGRLRAARRFGSARFLRGAGGFALGGLAVQTVGNMVADEFTKSGKLGAARAVDVTSGAGQGALYGAAIGSIVPGVGTALGAAIGGGIGLIAGGVEAANRRQEQQIKQKDIDQKEMLQLLKEGNKLLQKASDKETIITMDSRVLGQTQNLGTFS